MYNPVEQQMSGDLSERIEAAISAGIRQGQAELSKRRKRMKRRIGGTAAACIVLFSCLFTIRVSPVFAAMVRDIPGLEIFVDLIRNSSDKGIQLAVDNDFIQPVGVSDEHDGLKFTVQGIIADDSRMVVFYEVKFPGNDEYVELNGPNLMDMSGKTLPAMIGYNYPDQAKQDIRKSGIQRGTVDVQLSQGTTLPSEVRLQMKFKKSHLPSSSDAPKDRRTGLEDPAIARSADGGGPEFQVQIPIDHARFAGMRREYAIGQTIVAEGQRIIFSKAVISPLRVSLYLEYDKENTRQIFGPGDIRLVDDKGKVWSNYMATMEKDHPVFHFESPYFNEPKSLTLEGSWFRALDKKRMTVTVDTEKGLLLQAPDGKLGLHDVTKSDEYTKLDFSILGVDHADNMMYDLFQQEFTDATGQSYKTGTYHEYTGAYVNSSGPMHTMFYLDNKRYKQPLTFTIFNYPSYIRQPYKIRIK